MTLSRKGCANLFRFAICWPSNVCSLEWHDLHWKFLLMHLLHSGIRSTCERNGLMQSSHDSGHSIFAIWRRNGQVWHFGSRLNRKIQESPPISDSITHWTVLVNASRYLWYTFIRKAGSPIAPPQKTASTTRVRAFINVAVGVITSTRWCPFYSKSLDDLVG